ncbi:MAG: hypothetical protein MOGMAGMI_01327 [Candidatus Omnitrophica bacterium]|nr:hypothetical protein [Candidatus Omnitrophota bacterium]
MSSLLSAVACSVCFGDPAAEVNRGIVPALWVMLGLIATILSAIAWTGVSWARRAKRLEL